MVEIQNDTPRYINQYYKIKDNLKMPGNEAVRTCNISCVSMITDEEPNGVLQWFFDKYGYCKKFQWEENLISYLKMKGHKCKSITALSYPKPRHITDDEIKKMMRHLRYGNVIFYHKKGHYYLIIGYVIDDNESLSFICNDPAGDRKLSKRDRLEDSGHTVIYPVDMIKAEKIYGRNWSVEL